MNDLSSFDFEFVVDARREVVEDDHLRLGPEAVLFLDPDPDQGLDARAASDSAHRRDRTVHWFVIQSWKKKCIKKLFKEKETFEVKLDVEWCIGSTFDYDVRGPGFDSHRSLHFLEALIYLLSKMDCKAYSCNISITSNIWYLLSQISLFIYNLFRLKRMRIVSK